MKNVRRRCGLMSNYFDHLLLLLGSIAVAPTYICGLLLRHSSLGFWYLCWTVYLSVCPSITIVSPAKRLNRSRCRLECGLESAQRTRCYMEVQTPKRKEVILRGKVAGPGHARTCPAVDIHKATQQGAAPVPCGCRLGCTRW